VCEKYDVLRGREMIVARFPLYDENYDERWWVYSPLEDSPGLYLKFAQLHEEPDFEAAALAFSHAYGLPDGRHESDPYSEIGVVVVPDRLNLSRFRAEVRRAWAILRMYEAFLNSNVQAVIDLLSDHRDYGMFRAWHESFGSDPETDRAFLTKHPYLAFGYGLMSSVEDVQDVVDRFCRQKSTLHFKQSGSLPLEVDVVNRWHTDNLLRAMYLQMQGLMTSGGRLRRCEYPGCGKVISLARPDNGDRKPHRHKRFCDDACREANRRLRKKEA
jgi:hypothetical protein